MDKTLESLRQAVSIAKSTPRGGRKRWPLPTAEEIKRLREHLNVSQSEFARCYGLDPASVKHWEAHRRVPEQTSCLLLQMIAYEPRTVARLVRLVQQKVEEKQLEDA